MGFKMKGFNAGKGTGTSKGFPYVGEYIPQSDGSVIWQPTKEERIKRIQEENAKYVEPPKEDPLGLSENQRRLYNEAKTKVIKAIQEGKEPSGYSQWLKNIAQYGGNEGAEFLYQFVEPISKLDYGSRKMKKFYRKLDQALGEDGKLDTQVLNDVYKKMRIDQDPTDRVISYHNPHTGRVDLHKIKGQVEGHKMRYDESYEGPGVDMTLEGKQYTQEELDELAEIEKETGIPAFDPADTNKDDHISEEEKLAYEKITANKNQEENVNVNEYSGDEEVAIGSGDEESDTSVDVAEKTFDPRDTNQDDVVDKWEEKAAKRAAMFAKKTNPHKFDSPEWWEWKNASNVAKSNTRKSAFTVLSKYGKKWI